MKQEVFKPGQKVGKCTFIKRTKNRYAMFRCECGKEFESFIPHVRREKTVSCGCAHLIKYKKGQKIGNMIYLYELEPYHAPNGTTNRRAAFKCECGEVVTAVIGQVKSGQIRSCGCFKKSGDISRKHGLWLDDNYGRWLGMIERCYNPKCKGYKYYGARGISVCDKWREDPTNYIDYIMSLPGANDDKLCTIDRVDNDGNYEPGNLRWADYYTQANNKRPRGTVICNH